LKSIGYLNGENTMILASSNRYVQKNSMRKLCYVYLLAVPPLATALAFIVGHTTATIYLPLWFLNALLMTAATRILVKDCSRSVKRVAWYLIIPWILIAIFGGMGPPPETAAAWAALAGEQRVRYTILIVSGSLTFLGLIRLSGLLHELTARRLARASAIMIWIAWPLFILNMAYWGYFQTHVFITYGLQGAVEKPAWLKSLADGFTLLRMAEVALIYLATAVLALALKHNDLLSKSASRVYVVLACLAAVLNLLPGSINGPLAIANYLSYVPAFTLLMPYIIALNLVRKGL
jgi:hypothetical protein